MVPDIQRRMTQSKDCRALLWGRKFLGTILENAEIARVRQKPLCQDTNYDRSLCQHRSGGRDNKLASSVTPSTKVREGYEKGYLRKFVVGSLSFRKTQKDTYTPAVLQHHPRRQTGDTSPPRALVVKIKASSVCSHQVKGRKGEGLCGTSSKRSGSQSLPPYHL